ncbi:MAG: HNH endonuclease [Clostridiaceae bacterium]
MMDWDCADDYSAGTASDMPAERLADTADGWAETDLPGAEEADLPPEGDSAWDCANSSAGAASDMPTERLADTADGWAETDLPGAAEADLPPEGDSVWDCADSTAKAAGDAADDTGDALWDTPRTEAEKAADYIRSFSGFEKAADYVERHYAGDEFVPGDVISITTRNQELEGGTSNQGVPFSRREVKLDDGLVLEGVFPEFNSLHHVELGDAAKDMNRYQQFSACKADFQDHLSDNRNALEKLTLGDMERLSESNQATPRGYTWDHNPETGAFDLVPSGVHRTTGHTGGNALYGKS